MEQKELKFLQGEYWYGGAVNDGYLLPLSRESEYELNFDFNDTYNQINPLYVSSKGRYIWLEKGGRIHFQKGVIVINAEEIEIDDSGKNLMEAQQNAAKKHFRANGKKPEDFIFKSPQICSWIVFQHSQDQQKVLGYAKSYVEAGYSAGSFILDNSWQKNYGDWDFNREVFPDPEKMLDELHNMGFKVVLWLVPYVAPDAESCRELMENDGLIADENGNPRLMNWWDGDSYALDFTKPYANEWLKREMNKLKTKYGIDGFKLDGGDSQFLWKDYSLGNTQNELWARVADEIDETFVELRGCYKNGGRGYRYDIEVKIIRYNKRRGRIMFEFLFLGTSAWDYSERLQSDFRDCFDYDARRAAAGLLNGQYLIDCGFHCEDSLRIANVDTSKISDIFITHLHEDHCDFVFIEKLAKARTSPLFVWVRQDAELPNLTNVVWKRMNKKEIYKLSNDMTVVGLYANHEESSYPQHLLFERQGKRFLYACDGAWFLYETYYALKDANLSLLVLDCTCGDYEGEWRMAEHNSIPMLRLMLPSLKNWGTINERTEIYISHLAPSLHKPHFETAKLLSPDGVKVAYDGLRVEV